MKRKKKLALNRETLQNLQQADLFVIAGGTTAITVEVACPSTPRDTCNTLGNTCGCPSPPTSHTFYC